MGSKEIRLLKEIDSRANPFELEGAVQSALLVHGLTGTCAEMLPIGQMISKEFGWHVLAPLLPGHGTTLKDLEQTTWLDWFGGVERAWNDLRVRNEPIHLIGLSMGALLCLELFRQHPTSFASISLLVPPVWLRTVFQRVASQLARISALASFIPSAPKRTPTHPDHIAYDYYGPKSTGQFAELYLRAQTLTPTWAPPAFICYSDADEVVHPKSGPFLAERLNAPVKRVLHLTRSTHVVSIGEEKMKLLSEMKSFYLEIANAERKT